MEDLVNPVDAAAWRGRRVFVTGHSGFKGGWLALWLQTLGARVAGYALAPPTTPSLHEVARIGSLLERQWQADVRDAALLRSALADASPEVVFHLAAQPLVRASYADPLETFSSNVMGTAHLLDAARSVPGVRAVVVVTTDKCYAERRAADARPHPEDDRLGGHDPYSASKACAELVTASFRDAYALPAGGLGVATARAGNVLGGGDWSVDRLLPDLLRAVDAGEPIVLRRPQAVRPWQHVLEPLAGYLQLAQALLQDAVRFSGPWNFGPDVADAWPVQRVAEAVLQRAAGGAGLRIDAAASPEHETALLMLDAGKARRQLGWTPRLALEDALAWTWDWHHAWRTGRDMQRLCRQQIDSYMAAQ